jgi:hypothetical protein
LFNWSDQPTTLQVSFAQLGLDAAKEYLVRDFWSGEFLGPRKDLIELRLEPHSNRLLAVHAALDRPQYLATDRHVSQGGVELNNMAWNQERAELVCTFNLVEKDPLTATFHVPPSFAFAQATAEGATVEKTSAPSPSLLSVTLRRETPGEAKLRLAFQPSKSNP